ncbi:MAG: hypothetical protein H0V05_02385 [Euzebyaceae bacterium]|nr:hypothetical protein [Euzebyaceae bacterium]
MTAAVWGGAPLVIAGVLAAAVTVLAVLAVLAVRRAAAARSDRRGSVAPSGLEGPSCVVDRRTLPHAGPRERRVIDRPVPTRRRTADTEPLTPRGTPVTGPATRERHR